MCGGVRGVGQGVCGGVWCEGCRAGCVLPPPSLQCQCAGRCQAVRWPVACVAPPTALSLKDFTRNILQVDSSLTARASEI